MNVDPLVIKCPHCRMRQGEACQAQCQDRIARHRAARPHRARVRLALQMAAHADTALDEWPQLGPVSPCGLCGSGLPQRHRIVDAIAGRLAGGEDHEDIAADYGLPMSAIQAITEWDAKWGRVAWS